MGGLARKMRPDMKRYRKIGTTLKNVTVFVKGLSLHVKGLGKGQGS